MSQVKRILHTIGYGFIVSLNTIGELVLLLGKYLLFLFTQLTKGSLSLTKLVAMSPFHATKQIKKTLSKRPRKKHTSKTFYPLPIRIKTKYFIYGLFFSCIFVFIPLLTLLFLQDLPNPRMLSARDIPQTTKIYDRNNTLLFQIYASENRTLVKLDDIPLVMQQATIAIEDKNFYSHPGFDISAIIRAFHQDTSGGSFQGGSTITQQLIKSSMLTPVPDIVRKIKELILAFWAERLYTKKQILAMYLNQVPYGGTAWGIEAASEVYFDKSVHDIDLAEASFLAGLTSAPSSYSPFGPNPTLWKQRQALVLKKMVALKYISQKQADMAKAEELHFHAPQTPIFAPHFVNYVEDFLIKKYGLPTVEKGGLIVKTSIDLKLQDQIQQIVSDEVTRDAYLNITNGAAVVTNPKTGEILAMVGSRDYDYPGFGKVNVTTALRQPGSSIKVVTYATALSHGFTAATILDDSPITYTSPGAPPYAPVNYDGRFHGRVPLRFALANSFNIPAVKTLNQIGIQPMVAVGKHMGITTWNHPSQYGLSITLGGVEVKMVDMATVYGTLANGGKRVDLNPILDITDYKGSVIEKSHVVSDQVLDAGVAYILSDILADNGARSLEFGPASPLFIPGHYVSVKTGTTDNKRDNWTIGYTPNVVVATWVGNNDNSPMSQNLASGITGAAPMWNRIMQVMLQRTPETKYPLPADIVSKPCNGRTEYFLRGTESNASCGFSLHPAQSPTPTHKP